MMGFKRDRKRRLVRTRPGSRIETLENRDLMTGYNFYSFADVQPRTVNPNTANNYVVHPIGQGAGPFAGLYNEGRFITGQDRQGDTYTLTLHGPGYLVVTDATPNDGSLDDDINTIQIVGSSLTSTYVTGQVTATANPVVAADTGEVYFNHLIAQNGVKSIILNGFSLIDNVVTIAGQPNNTGPAINLAGGVGTLSFHNVYNVTDLNGPNGGDLPMQIVIGSPTTPLKVSPRIQLDNIFNTVLDSSATSQVGIGPRTEASVNIEVNGNIHSISIASATAQTITGGAEFNFPRTDVTGRTAIRATGIDHLKVSGSARNLTASRAGSPFQGQNGLNSAPASGVTTAPFRSGFSGLNHLGTAVFQGTADGVGLDVHGKIGTVKFLRGAGDPTGSPLNPSQYGSNAAEAGYASRGLTGALVKGKKIGKVVVGPSNLALATSTIPANAQSIQGTTQYYSFPGQALVNAAIVSGGSIGNVNVVGTSQSSEIAAGYDYRSYTAGLEPVRGNSKIGHFRQRGDLIDSVVSSSYRPSGGTYGTPDDAKGHGSITGHLNGRVYTTGRQTILGNTGSGFYARTKHGYLPPPQGPLLHNQQRRRG